MKKVMLCAAAGGVLRVVAWQDRFMLENARHGGWSHLIVTPTFALAMVLLSSIAWAFLFEIEGSTWRRFAAAVALGNAAMQIFFVWYRPWNDWLVSGLVVAVTTVAWPVVFWISLVEAKRLARSRSLDARLSIVIVLGLMIAARGLALDS